MRNFRFITRGKIVRELFNEGLTNITFSQLHRFEKRGIIPQSRRNGGGWRIFSREEADKVKEIIWEWYGGKKTYINLPDTIREEKLVKRLRRKEINPIDVIL